MSSPKNRDYFITINQTAECYEDALDIVKELNTKLYALIIHDKDVLTEIDKEGVYIETPKAIHKHIVIELNNPITFQSIKNHFKGAHIEVIKYKKAAYQYLLHESPHSKGEKYNYPLKDIISNNLKEIEYAISAEEGLEIFKENMFLSYIAEGIITPYQFTKRFGLNVYKQYWRSYADMLEQLKYDAEMMKDLKAIKEAMQNDLPF